MNETTTCCPVCGEEKIYAPRNMREHERGVIVRERYCSACGAEWQTTEKFVKLIGKNVHTYDMRDEIK
jgi:transcriptional regulator NrdR family protein